MTAVPAGYASWLKSPCRYAATTISGAQAAYGDLALDSSVTSALALQADAQNEATRQAQFLAGPTAKDSHVVPGRRRDLMGKVVTLYNKRLGYVNGSVAFVIGTAEADDGTTTTLTVIKVLGT